VGRSMRGEVNKVLDNREFIRWFLEEVRRRLGCIDVEVYSALVLAGAVPIVLDLINAKPGDVVVMFTCCGRKCIAKVRAKVSLYVRKDWDGKVEKVRIGDPRLGSFLIYDNSLGLYNNALIRIDNNTSIEIYELHPLPTHPIREIH